MRLLHRIAFFTLGLCSLLVGLAVSYGQASPVPELAFESGDGWTANIYVMDLRARVPFNVSSSVHRNVSPAWTADGEAVTFASNRRGDFALYRVDLTGRATVRLLEDSPHTGFSLRWSPDGQRLAYLSGVGTFTDLYVMMADGTPRKLTHGAIISEPAWAPDSSRIAYVNARQNRPDIFVVTADGGATKRVTNGVQASSPMWLPDGEHIAYTAVRDGLRQLYVVRADGTNPRLVIDALNVWSVSWSPTGEHFVYVVGERDRRDLYLATVQPGGTNETIRVTQHMVTGSISWTVDGSWVAFAARSAEGDQTEIYAVEVASGRRHRLTYTPMHDMHPVWRPNKP